MLVRSGEQIEELLNQVENVSETYIDLETTGLDPWSSIPVGAAIKPRNFPARYVSLKHSGWNLERGYELLAEVVDRANAISNHNLYGFDGPFLSAYHVTDSWRDKPGRDSQLAIRLLDENCTHRLKDWSVKVFGPEAAEPQRKLDALGRERGWGDKVMEHMADLRAEEVAEYACQDVGLVERVLDYADPRLERLGLTKIADEYNSFGSMLAGMYVDGIALDRDRACALVIKARVAKDVADKLACLEAGKSINLNSPPQLQKELHSWTSEAWLVKALAREGNKFAERLVEYRLWKKSVEFYDGYLEHLRPDHRLHPRFRVIRTGRISYADPNLHSTPHYSEHYKQKDCFVAEPGTQLLLLDWSQAEAKLCAHYNHRFGHDPMLFDLFMQGADFHEFAFGMLDDILSSRAEAKTMNYASFYGMGKTKYARKYGVTETEAAKRLKAYHERIPGPRELYRHMEKIARRTGAIRLWDGSYRRLPGAGMNWPKDASNSLLQGGVGAMARKAMLRMRDALDPSKNERWLLQIHDALLCQIDLDRDEKFVHDLAAEMSRFSFDVPMTVDAKWGPRWSELKAV